MLVLYKFIILTLSESDWSSDRFWSDSSNNNKRIYIMHGAHVYLKMDWPWYSLFLIRLFDLKYSGFRFFDCWWFQFSWLWRKHFCNQKNGLLSMKSSMYSITKFLFFVDIVISILFHSDSSIQINKIYIDKCTNFNIKTISIISSSF